jgi:hypothetical protein
VLLDVGNDREVADGWRRNRRRRRIKAEKNTAQRRRVHEHEGQSKSGCVWALINPTPSSLFKLLLLLIFYYIYSFVLFKILVLIYKITGYI